MDHFFASRKRTEELCLPLAIEDYSVQPMVDVSPPKWHLAHVTWFYEAFVLKPHLSGYKEYDADFAYLFNSYYNNAGERVLRPNRGLMTRPKVDEVLAYRQYVTNAVGELLDQNPSKDVIDLIEVGINHEQQHQELLTYDIKYILGHQPTFPSYCKTLIPLAKEEDHSFTSIEEGVYTIGHRNDQFSFDNELGVHKVFLHDFEIRNSLVTNGEYIDFINAGGYEDFNLWHAEGWDWVKTNEVKAPMYWYKVNGDWKNYNGLNLSIVDKSTPVVHINYYEAFAFAEWKKMRLPTEFEWEVASDKLDWGALWEWTGSAYLPYPGFSKAPGALGEYNGKFMVSQHVLRGASFMTPDGHARHTYRNFFHPSMRWMFCGIRLAK